MILARAFFSLILRISFLRNFLIHIGLPVLTPGDLSLGTILLLVLALFLENARNSLPFPFPQLKLSTEHCVRQLLRFHDLSYTW